MKSLTLVMVVSQGVSVETQDRRPLPTMCVFFGISRHGGIRDSYHEPTGLFPKSSYECAVSKVMEGLWPKVFPKYPTDQTNPTTSRWLRLWIASPHHWMAKCGMLP